MRPDRIIVGECRAGEALDMLQAMNTGHEGSMTTVHANSARDALSRLETMVLMAGFDLPVRAIREQIASAIDLILQVDRMPDGRRVVTAVTEVQGLEGDTILLQDIFKYRQLPGGDGGKADRRARGHRPAARSSSTSSPSAASRCPASAFKAPGRRRARAAAAATDAAAARSACPTAREVADRERLR